jgi:hypothetical protein
MTAVLIDFRGNRFHVLQTEFPHIFTNQFLFLSKFEIHNIHPLDFIGRTITSAKMFRPIDITAGSLNRNDVELEKFN